MTLNAQTALIVSRAPKPYKRRANPTRLERVDVRITMDERAEIQRIARDEGKSVSDLIRESVFGKGVSRRDYFAGQALPALIALYGEDRTWPEYAALAFDYADAMLAEAAS